MLVKFLSVFALLCLALIFLPQASLMAQQPPEPKEVQFESGTFTPFDVAPMPIDSLCPQPAYPAAAKAANWDKSVKVIVQVYITPEGNVKKYKIVQEQPHNFGFAREVEKVIKRWKFTPAMQKDRTTGQPKAVGVWCAIPFKFDSEPTGLPPFK